MVVAEDKVVSLAYELRLDNNTGKEIETVGKESPLKFLYGAGNLLQAFEKNIAGLNVGDPFTFTLNPEDAYGDVNPQAIVDVNKSMFVVDGKLRDDLLFIGNTIPMQDSGGNPLQGQVIEVADETVKLDFNHPMAGKTLCFSGEVVEVREATADEIINGYPEGMGGHGCGGGDCNGGDCGSDGQAQESGGCGNCSCG